MGGRGQTIGGREVGVGREGGWVEGWGWGRDGKQRGGICVECAETLAPNWNVSESKNYEKS